MRRDSFCVYDVSCELIPEAFVRLCPGLDGLEFVVDLYGAKSWGQMKKPFALTTRGLKNTRDLGRSECDLWNLT